MKQKMMILAAGAALFMGCSADEELANVAKSTANEIQFNVVNTQPKTKATLINSTQDLQGHPFRVYAFKGTEPFMNGVEVGYSGGAWTYEGDYYWPHSDKLDFYAVCSGRENAFLSDLTMSSAQQSFSLFINDEYGNAGVPAENMDVMYALAKQQAKLDHNGVVPLKFKHALCQVLFNAKKSERTKSIQVEINGVKLCNVSTKGTYTFPLQMDEAGTWQTEPLLISKYQVKLDSDTPIRVSSDLNIATPLSTTKPLLCIPQALTAWRPSTDSPINTSNEDLTTNDNSSFLQIACKIWKDGQYFVGSADAFGYTYVPFSATWEEGKRYIYTLHFGGGYNADGTEVDIVPITFTAEAENWADDPQDVTGF